MTHPDGELATSRAVTKKGLTQAISSFANFSVKDIRNAGLSVGPIKHAMQMYTLKNRDLQLSIIQEAEKQGCSAIFLTVRKFKQNNPSLLLHRALSNIERCASE